MNDPVVPPLDFGDQKSLDAALSTSIRGLNESGILRITRQVRGMLARGETVVNLTVGDFDPRHFPIPRALAQGIQDAVARGETNYPTPEGMLALREAISDSILKRLPANGGVVMVTFVPGFVTTTPGGATLSQVADHIEHIKRVAGADHVGIGGDFDGISIVVKGLEDVSKYPDLFAELVRRGWSDADLRKLAGENILRAMERAEGVSEKLRRSRPPSTKTIAQLDAK